MNNIIPFIIPDKFAADIANGTIKRFGTLLIEGNKIRGHVQEASLLQQILFSINPSAFFFGSGNLASSIGANVQLSQIKGMLSVLKLLPASVFLDSTNLVSSVAANVQLQQIKNMLGGLQLLGSATLAASVAGIGISAVGFALVNKKLNFLQQKITTIESAIQQANISLKYLAVRQKSRDFAKLQALLAQGEEAWSRSDKFSIWKKLAYHLMEEDQYYRLLLGDSQVGRSLLLEDTFPLEESVALFDAFLAVTSSRLQALLLINECEAAKHYAEDVDRWYRKAFDHISPIDIVSCKAPFESRQTKRKLEDVKHEMLQKTKPFMGTVREIQLNTATRPQLIQALSEQNIDGYAYIRALRQETASPILILPDDRLVA